MANRVRQGNSITQGNEVELARHSLVRQVWKGSQVMHVLGMRQLSTAKVMVIGTVVKLGKGTAFDQGNRVSKCNIIWNLEKLSHG